MPLHEKETIRIGTMAGRGPNTAQFIRDILPLGFESFQINFWKNLQGLDLSELSRQINDILADEEAIVSCMGVYGNPLGDTPDDAETRQTWETVIDHAKDFGTDLVCGFSGRVRGASIPDSMPRFKEVFGDLVKRAEDQGVRIAFENCEMGGTWQSGDWNLAHTPAAWDLLFDAIPSDNLGLEWEPCHQMVKLIDPMPQLREWVKKIFHVHGKDATVYWDVVRKHGIGGSHPFAFHRTPGFGDSNWTDIISELRRGGFVGAIDIEGYHDPIYREELEMTGQVRGLRHLQGCRGEFVPNPASM